CPGFDIGTNFAYSCWARGLSREKGTIFRGGGREKQKGESVAKAVSKKGAPTKATTRTRTAAKPATLLPAAKSTGKTVPTTKPAPRSDNKVTAPAAKVVDAKKGGPIAIRGEKAVKPTAKVQPVPVKAPVATAKAALPPRELPRNG